ncbi:MAG: sugar ABC transporter substrate-binding protein [Blautia sp.]|nr:sugar ABC transporter substrate-binding protein [Blautia sp.]MDY5030362.1 sugar ABC transporter substrate-binding protein [Blautia sp.]
MKRRVFAFLMCAAMTIGLTGSANVIALAEEASESSNEYYEYIVPAGTQSDVNDYYAQYGIECDIQIKQTGGSVLWLNGNDVAMPTAAENYTIGFADYATDDEVSSGYMNAMKEAAEELGINVLYNDAHWTQDEQNQAIEQWILQKVDGIILCPCDYYGVKDALDACEEAGIPVVSFDAPPNAGNVDAVIMYDAVEQGRLAGEALRDALLESGSDMNGTIYYGNLPYLHPNAQTREFGFKSAFEDYPNIKFKMLTGETPEEFYTAMEGAILAEPDMLGAWGLFSAATWGMLQAIEASGESILLSSVDCDSVILKGINDGKILGSTCYSPTEGARLAAMTLVNLLNGETVPGITYQSNTFLTEDNVEELYEVYHPGESLS